MTIKKRFLISYIGGIAIACLSLISIICIGLYVTTGKIPSLGSLYRTFTQQRSLTPEEELAYVKLRNAAKTNPDQLLHPSKELIKTIEQFEEESLGIVVRKQGEITYFSQDLVEKSLVVHFPPFDANNLETRGTIDNAGRLYRFMKFDFYFSDQVPGSLLVLKQENTILEFMTKWGILIIAAILFLSISALLYLNYLLRKTVIYPLEALGTGMAEIRKGHLDSVAAEQTKQAALEVQQLTDDFEKMRNGLIQYTKEREKLENNRKELVASISHDLKTPITSIIGYVEGLLDGVADSPEKQAKYLETIRFKAVSLNELIEELFLYSKLDADAVPFHFEKTQLLDFLKHRIEEFSLQDQTVTITLHSPNVVDAYVMADRLQLNRVFINLIENSLKFKAADRSLTIELSVVENEATLAIVIADNGQGIPKDQLPFVFDHFYRGEKERSTQTGGSGLGLAIIKQIVERHGGEVLIESQYQQGTTVKIILKKCKGGT